MAIICVHVVELLCPTMIGQLLVLKYLLPGACGYLLPRIVVPGIKCRYFPRVWLRWCLSDDESPRAWLPRA
jgi:hypothetical protein